MDKNPVHNRKLANVCYLALILIFATLAEVTTFYFYMTEKKYSIWLLLLAHTIIFLFLCFYSYFKYQDNRDIRLHYFSCIALLFCGPFGSFAGLLCCISYLIFDHFLPANFMELHDRLFPDQIEGKDDMESIHNRILEGQEMVSGNVETEPFVDIMDYGNVNQRQQVVVKIVKHFRTQFAPILLQALNDSSHIIRVQAAAAIAKLENTFTKKYKEYDEITKEDQSNLTEILAFAQLCEGYANSELLDHDRIAAVRKKCIQLYQRCIRLDPQNHNFVFHLARMYMLDGEITKSYELLQDKFDKLGDYNAFYVSLILEVLYNMKRYSQIRRIVRKSWHKLQQNIKSRSALENFKIWTLDSGFPILKGVKSETP